MFSMHGIDGQILHLRDQVAEAERQLAHLRAQLNELEAYKSQATLGQNLETEWQAEIMDALSGEHSAAPASFPNRRFALSSDEYKRYGRQLIMPQVALKGQLRLKAAKVLIVGAGGLGCPAAAYLAGAGVGTLGLIDGDTVELSNLHRQIAHSTGRVGLSKVDSAIAYCKSLNPDVTYVPHPRHLVPEDALDVISNYDLVLDCTDHPTSRYLVSDACVLAGKPLVSASALRTEGQLTVLNNPAFPPGSERGGPCYRCIFPRPPPAESVTSCGEGGILGPVVGLMGVLQALEALKLLTSDPPSTAPQPTLLLFSAYSSPQFRTVRLRSRRKDCVSCSAFATITPQALTSGSLDYVAFCGVTNPVSILPHSSRLEPQAFASLSSDPTTVVLDVRDKTQFELCALPASINIPWSTFPQVLKEQDLNSHLFNRNVVVVCKLGNDSQLAVKALEQTGVRAKSLRDLRGGFRAWREEVDDGWPDY